MKLRKFNILYENIMKTLLLEGGHAISDITNKIARENIQPTIDFFEDIVFKPLKITKDCWTAEIGSTGKKEFSGDIDIAINYNEIKQLTDLKTDTEIDEKIKEQLIKNGIEFVTKNGINIRIPLQGSQIGEYAQMDLFKTSNIEFTKFAKFGPSPTESKYKGAIRSEILRQMLKIVSLKAAEELDNETYTAPDGIIYPAKKFTQYSFCNDGLYKTYKSFIGKRGGTLTNPLDLKDKTELITQCPQEMIDIIFGKGKYVPSDFNSFESIWNNVLFNKNFPYKDKINQIILRTKNILEKNKMQIPQEMLDYLGENNK